MMELENRRTSRAPSFPKSLKPEPVVSRFSQVRRSLDAQLSQTDSNQRLTIENIAVGLLCAQRRRSRRATLFASDGTGRGLRHSQSFPQQLSREALRAAEAENLDRRSAQARRAAMQRQRVSGTSLMRVQIPRTCFLKSHSCPAEEASEEAEVGCEACYSVPSIGKSPHIEVRPCSSTYLAITLQSPVNSWQIILELFPQEQSVWWVDSFHQWASFPWFWASERTSALWSFPVQSWSTGEYTVRWIISLMLVQHCTTLQVTDLPISQLSVLRTLDQSACSSPQPPLSQHGVHIQAQRTSQRAQLILGAYKISSYLLKLQKILVKAAAPATTWIKQKRTEAYYDKCGVHLRIQLVSPHIFLLVLEITGKL